MSSTILQYFPLAEPRPKQIQALHFIEEAVRRNYKDIVIEAPTGIGKSGIGICAGFWIANEMPTVDCRKGAYYLVTQKLLQDQLSSDIIKFKTVCSDCSTIKSSEEYRCDQFQTCATGLRMSSSADRANEKRKSLGKGSLNSCSSLASRACAYQLAKGRFINSTVGITNYAYFFTSRMYTDSLEKRQLLICDEAQTTADQIIKFIDGSVSSKQVEKWIGNNSWPKITSIDEYVAWLSNVYVPKLLVVLENQKEFEILEDTVNEGRSKEIVELDKHLCKIVRVVTILQENSDNWIFWEEENKDKSERQYVVRPIFGAEHSREFITSAASVRIYMSAYLGSKEVYCKDLGLDYKKVAWLSLDSDFPVKNRQIHCYSLGHMGFKNRNESCPNILKAVVKIANKHQDRGLIHCLEGNSIVSMSDGTKKMLKCIQEKDSVISWNTEDKKFEVKKVSAVFYRGERDCIKLTFENGKTLECTEDHLILTKNRGWVMAKNLTISDDLVSEY